MGGWEADVSVRILFSSTSIKVDGVRFMFVVEWCLFAKRSLVNVLTGWLNETSYRVRWITKGGRAKLTGCLLWDSAALACLGDRVSDYTKRPFMTIKQVQL